MRQVLPLALLFAFITACSSAVEPTALPTLIPTEAPTATNTPPPEPSPLPSVLELTRATDPSQQAYLSVIHAAFDVPTFDVYVERLAIGTNLSYSLAAQPSALVAGDYYLRVVPNGVRPDAGEVLYESPISLKGGDSLLLLFTAAPDGLHMASFAQPLEPLESNQSRITVIHAIPDGPEITMQQSGVALTSPMTFGRAAYPVVVPTGEIMLDFIGNGVSLLTYSAVLQERFSYVLVLAGAGSDPENLSIIEMRNPVPGRANLRAINASPTVGPVDVYLDDALLADSLTYPRESDRQPKAAQVYAVSLYPAGADRTAADSLLSTQLVVNNDDYISLLILGSAPNLRLVPVREDRSLTAPDRTRILFVNTLEQVPRIRIDMQNRILTEVGELGYAQPSQAVTLPAGSYRFSSIRVENGSPVELVEQAENVQLEPGRSYLYLITRRIGDPPIVLSDNLGIDPALAASASGETPTPVPDIPTTIRFINAINGGLPLEVRFDGQLLVTGLGYGSSSDISMVDPGDHTLDVSAGGQNIISSDVTLDLSTPYAVAIYGFGTDQVETMLIDDSDVVPGDSSPHFRLLNLSMYGEATLTLATSRSQAPSDSVVIFSESPASDIFRRSLAFGIEISESVQEAAGRAYSNVALAPLGPHDLHVVDTRLNMIAASYRGVDLRPGAHYDVIAYQHSDTMLVEGFAVRYPGS